jgi:large subunit ribosomal protein L6
MSRIGKKPVLLPEGVEVKEKEGEVHVKGPRGTISRLWRPEVKLELKGSEASVIVVEESKAAKAFQGLFRSLLANDVQGVTQGWEKTLELEGVGYRAKMEEEKLVLEVGFSHSVVIKPEEEIKFEVEKGKIIVSGIRKDQVGKVAAQIRAVRPPEPYKGKGIHYLGEEIQRKEGKKAAASS